MVRNIHRCVSSDFCIMKIYKKPASFDGAKFASRYKLDPFKDFYDDGLGNLVVLKELPDDPPIFEAPDPAVKKPTLEERVTKLEAKLGG